MVKFQHSRSLGLGLDASIMDPMLSRVEAHLASSDQVVSVNFSWHRAQEGTWHAGPPQSAPEQ